MNSRLLVFLSLLVTVCNGNQEDTVVHTKHGSVRGFVQQSSKGNAIYSFMSIPYAAPPVGHLRFKPPQPVQEWDNVLKGTNEPPFCIQYGLLSGTGLIGQEDCLYLNVYSRKIPANDYHPKLPVMIWIHGGAFTVSSGSPVLYSPKILLNKNMVLVTINYRLGPFGFLSTADDVVQGNMGLKDQSMALRWVKDNIEAFGGDSDRITIAGESAGSASVHYHMLSPMSRGLFHQAISQSGSALCPWAYLEPREIAARSKRLAVMLNCPTDNSKAMLSCLQVADANDVTSAIRNFFEWYVYPVAPFGPTTETAGINQFMTSSPREILVRGEVADVPWLTGICSSEGEYITAGIWKQNLLQDLNDNYLRNFPLLMEYKHLVDNPDKYSLKFREYYFGDQEISEETLHELTLMVSDKAVNYCNYEAVRKHQAANTKSPIYFYQLTFLGSFSYSQVSGYVGGGPSYKPFGASHVDDLLYLFQFPPMLPFEENSDEEKISDMITAWWASFLNTGNPTADCGKDSQVIWNPLERNHLNHLNISLTPKMQTNFFYERMSFWDELYKSMRATKTKEEL